MARVWCGVRVSAGVCWTPGGERGGIEGWGEVFGHEKCQGLALFAWIYARFGVGMAGFKCR